MKMKGYGPDILADVETSELVEIGIPPGDVLQLKRAAPVWWTSTDAKCQHTNGNGFGEEGLGDPVGKPLISLEKRYKDGSGAACMSGALKPTDDFFDEIYDWFFYLNGPTSSTLYLLFLMLFSSCVLAYCSFCIFFIVCCVCSGLIVDHAILQ